MQRNVAVLLTVLLLASSGALAGLGDLNRLSTYVSTDATGDPLFDEGLTEIAAYDAASERLFLTNGNDNRVDVLDLSDATAPSFAGSIDLSTYGDAPTSVAVFNGQVAVAVEAPVVTDPGAVAFFDAGTLGFAGSATAGPLPDMVTFTPYGSKLLVANEGEAAEGDPPPLNPPGSVSIIDTTTFAVSTAPLSVFDATLTRGADPAANVRIHPNASTPSADMEPEYITVSPDGSTAFVALQENNAIAVLDVGAGAFTDVLPLGVKDHSQPGNALDANKNDDAADIRTEALYGMYMPDGIAAYDAGGTTYIVTANEGDSRDDDFGEFSTPAHLADEGELGDTITGADLAAGFPDPDIAHRLSGLELSQVDGLNGSGKYEKLYTFGARSFSIFDESGTLVFDSGDDFEQQVNATYPAHFNAGDDNVGIDDRSDDAGPEPEGVDVGQVAGRTLAFVGLEKIGGVMAYDVTDPAAAQLLTYTNNRLMDQELLDDFMDYGDASPAEQDAVIAALQAGTFDIGPEGLLFIPGSERSDGLDLLVVTNEVSGTTTVYQVVPEPASAGLLALAGLALLRRRRR